MKLDKEPDLTWYAGDEESPANPHCIDCLGTGYQLGTSVRRSRCPACGGDGMSGA